MLRDHINSATLTLKFTVYSAAAKSYPHRSKTRQKELHGDRPEEASCHRLLDHLALGQEILSMVDIRFPSCPNYSFMLSKLSERLSILVWTFFRVRLRWDRASSLYNCERILAL